MSGHLSLDWKPVRGKSQTKLKGINLSQIEDNPKSLESTLGKTVDVVLRQSMQLTDATGTVLGKAMGKLSDTTSVSVVESMRRVSTIRRFSGDDLESSKPASRMSRTSLSHGESVMSLNVDEEYSES